MIEAFNSCCLVLITLALVYLSLALYTQPSTTDTTAHQRINQLSERTDAQYARLKQETEIRLTRLEGPVSRSQPHTR